VRTLHRSLFTILALVSQRTGLAQLLVLGSPRLRAIAHHRDATRSNWLETKPKVVRLFAHENAVPLLVTF
jgi:hypothetical protein